MDAALNTETDDITTIDATEIVATALLQTLGTICEQAHKLAIGTIEFEIRDNHIA